ncbi:MAG: carbohydrate-binding domain-containing protein [Clostridia bacterium]|nr:carbohydrate-binding domain-containing protein [Clostridia bacterium]
MSKKSISIVLLSICTLFTFSACTNQKATRESNDSLIASSNTASSSITAQAVEGDTQTKEKIDTYIIFDDIYTTVNGNGADFQNSILTITQSGTYSLTGTLSDGKIYVNITEEDKKVKLILNGVHINCSSDAPVFIENSPKETVLILAEGSVNNLSDTAREIPADENADYATAVIYSKDDLQIEGGGTLNVTANFNKGIFSKNDIDIRGGIINIESVDDGIRGKKSVEISDGTLNITSGGDGIRTNETAEEGKGSIEISGGSITVSSDLDCIQSVVDISISGGTFNLTSNGGSTGVASSSRDEFGMGGRPGGMGGGPGGMGSGPGGFNMYGGMTPPDSSADESSAEDTPSTKGIKADGKITVSGGTFTISSTDDALHAVNLDISGGSFSVRSDDDGFHADEALNIRGGEIGIDFSFEGVEGKIINIYGGAVKVTSSDDGFNAAGDTDLGMNPMAADYSCEINVTDGYVFINASGDGVDSNGNVNQSGGTIIVFGPENGANGALDYGGTYTVSGGTLLATGSAGMAQSVTGDGIDVLAFTYSCSADVLNAITDSKGNSLIGFVSPKQFGTVVFASDRIKSEESYDVYSGGSYSAEATDGVYLSGEYSKGEFVGTLTLS